MYIYYIIYHRTFMDIRHSVIFSTSVHPTFRSHIPLQKRTNSTHTQKKGTVIVFSLCSQFFLCCRMGGVLFMRQVPSQMRQALFRLRPLSFRMRTVSPLMRGAKIKRVHHGNREVLHCYLTPALPRKKTTGNKSKGQTPPTEWSPA